MSLKGRQGPTECSKGFGFCSECDRQPLAGFEQRSDMIWPIF